MSYVSRSCGGLGTHDDRSVLAKRCRNFVNWSTPSALAPCREHVVCEVVNVVVRPLVGFQVCLDATPLGLNGVRVIPLLTDERNGVISGTVRVTLSVEISVRSPAITGNHSAWFDPSIYNGHHGVSGSVRYRNKKCSARPTFDTREHSLTLNRVSAIVFSQTEHDLVDLDGLVRIADVLRAALHIHQHCLSAEHDPVRDRFGTKAILSLD